ncbi:acyl-coenzyme A thioesterase 1-like [Erpetoichthys calabaricus]|uniref:Acyl-coenzyme A thioesterase 1-like n=1 Tax=Erpetoichthys calabaricus TaxID=27687 RepID=A0A8C4T271_ERPCA|nr:acyl-coenzyme A thioesterase 1-like [Erpetoichthys calabaricus]
MIAFRYSAGATVCRLVSLASPCTLARLSSTSVRVGVSPRVALADERVHITVSGLSPSQEVTLRALVTSDDDTLFESCAQYRASQEGALDLSRDHSLGGSYNGIEEMGLLWSLMPASMEMPHRRIFHRDPMRGPQLLEFIVHAGLSNRGSIPGSVLARSCCKRWFCSPGVTRTRIREGRVRGSLFLPPNEGPFPGVIDMYDDDGGLTEHRASLLASRGFATLALPYVRFEDLPESIADVRFEYFEQAASLLIHHPKVLNSGVAAIGTGKGGELALAMVTFLPQVVAAISISGCHAVTGGELRYQGHILPGVGYTASRIRLLPSGILDLSETLNDPCDQVYQSSRIPIETADGHFLFVVGEDDKRWKSPLYAAAAVHTLDLHARNNYQVLTYPGAGHRIDPPWCPFAHTVLDPVLRIPVMEGGQSAPHSHAQAHSWQQILEFLHCHLVAKQS